jgi:hypothetical protein
VRSGLFCAYVLLPSLIGYANVALASQVQRVLHQQVRQLVQLAQLVQLVQQQVSRV